MTNAAFFLLGLVFGIGAGAIVTLALVAAHLDEQHARGIKDQSVDRLRLTLSSRGAVR